MLIWLGDLERPNYTFLVAKLIKVFLSHFPKVIIPQAAFKCHFFFELFFSLSLSKNNRYESQIAFKLHKNIVKIISIIIKVTRARQQPTLQGHLNSIPSYLYILSGGSFYLLKVKAAINKELLVRLGGEGSLKPFREKNVLRIS